MVGYPNEFTEYLDLILSLNPQGFIVKVPRGSTAGSQSRYYEFNNDTALLSLLDQERNIEYIKFWRDPTVFHGTIYPDDCYMKISTNSPEIGNRVWNAINTQNLGSYEVCIRLMRPYFRNQQRIQAS